MHKFCIILIFIFFIASCVNTNTHNISPTITYTPKPIPLVYPDPSNTKLELNPQGLQFLDSITNNIAVISVAGRAKTGKSFLLNNLMGVHHDKGFKVGVDFKPGTKGILMWGQPMEKEINGEKVTVIYMDTEGLAAPGNPTDSYDPKLCALAVVFSSLFIYNLNHEVQIRDINMLHSVVTLSRVFEKRFNKTFPFPPILWTVQDFEHELGDFTAETYLDWVLEEKNNINETLEIKKYNETVRVVKQFPDIGKPRILLMNHPHRTTRISKLPSIPFSELDKQYQQEVNLLKELINRRLKAKMFNHLAVNGKFLSNLARELVMSMNNMDMADVGPALVRELANELKKICFEKYKSKMLNLSLPQDVADIEILHIQSKAEALSIFRANCTGGLESYDNSKSYNQLQESIETFYKHHLTNNTLVAHMTCSKLVKELFQPHLSKIFDSIEDFDKAIEEFKLEYNLRSRGPKKVKQEVLESFIKQEISLKRELVLKENSQKDFKQIILILVIFFIFFFLASLVMPWDPLNQLLRTFYSGIVLAIILVLVVYHKIIDTEPVLTFEDIQYAFNIFKGIFGYANDAKDKMLPWVKFIYDEISPYLAPYKKQLIGLFICSVVILHILRKLTKKKPKIPKQLSGKEPIPTKEETDPEVMREQVKNLKKLLDKMVYNLEKAERKQEPKTPANQISKIRKPPKAPKKKKK